LTPAVSQPQGQTHRQNPGPSSPNEPGGIFTANLKHLEPANLCRDTIAEVLEAAQQGIGRVRHERRLLFSFLRHCGLEL
jgi:hypothetical protein